MKKLLFLLYCSIFLLQKNFSQTTTCDTLVLTDGNFKLVILGKSTSDELFFQLCDDSDAQFALPRSQVLELKKGKLFEQQAAAASTIPQKNEFKLAEKPEPKAPKPPKPRDKIFRISKYDVWLKTDKQIPLLAGNVVWASDSNLIFAPRGDSKKYKIPAENIEYLQMRGDHSIGVGALCGAALGFAAGFIIGAASTADSDNYYGLESFANGVIGGLSGIIAGGIIGAAIGSAKVTIPIEGKRTKLKNFSDHLRFN